MVQRIHALIARVVVLVLVGFFSAQAISADSIAGRITGQVVDRDTGEPLPGANVVIAGTSKGAATDIDGRFTLSGVSAGTHTLVASYIGYQRQEQQVTVEDGSTVEINFQLVWEAAEGDEVIITAQAAGQTAAINQQLSSNTITNIVSADRIQELPDVNAAESIGRLPGVSIQRSGGEANKVAIRGLSPKYNTVTVNGVRVPATGGDDRSVDLSLISSNMLNGIEVKKAITADQDADAIAGSVDLKLREAPEGFMVDVQAQGGYNKLQDYYGNYKFAGSMSNRFFGSRLGVIATFNADHYDRSADVFNGNYDQSENTGTGEQEILITSVDLTEQNVERGRIGASMLFDYQIPRGKLAGNAFYNRLSNDALNRVNQMFNSTNGRHFYNMQDTENTTSILTAALSAEQDFGRFRYDVGISRTGSRAENPRDYSWSFAQEGNAYTPFDRVPGMDPREVIQYITPDSTATGLADVYISETDREENNTAVQLNVTAPFSFGNHVTGYVKTGGKLRWLDRSNDEEQVGANGMHYGLSSTTQWLSCVDEQIPEGINGYDISDTSLEAGLVPIYMFDDGYEREMILDGDYPIGYTVDPEMAQTFAEVMSECPDAFLEQVNASRGRDYTGEERYEAAYVMAEINLGRYITFIPGIRWESDYSKYEGQQFREAVVNNQQAEPTDLETLIVERENDFWLPMVHLTGKPADWLQIRLARTETLARPDYIQYVPITRINSQLTFAFAGNSQLRPAHSTNYDAAVSIYQNKVGLFTVAAFHKEVDDHIRWVRTYTTTTNELPDYLNVPEGWLVENPVVDTYINNPAPATYKGFEVDWQTNFWYLPSFLKGLVLNVNYTRIFSETIYQSYELERVCTNCPSPRPRYQFESKEVEREGRMGDQPAHIANITLGYDYRGFSTRLSYLYQTDRVNNINVTTPVLDTFTGEYVRYDLSVRQKLQSGLEIFANFNNLTGTKDRSFQGSPDGSPTSIQHYGFTMDLGARFRF